MRRCLSGWVQCLQEGTSAWVSQGSSFCHRLACCHALDHLPYELISRKLDGDSIQFWSALSARAG